MSRNKKPADFPSLVSLFLEKLADFQYHLSGYDHVWDILFSAAEDRPRHVRIIKYRETRYLFHVDGNSCNLEITPKGKIIPSDSPAFSGGMGPWGIDPEPSWRPLFEGMYKWTERVKKDWIRAAWEIEQLYPLRRRTGTIPNSLVRASLPAVYRLDREIGEQARDTFIGLVESGYFNRNDKTTVKSMTARDFFHYCRIAYRAGKRPEDTLDESLSGREMYERYADGRHEGLLDIDETSPEEFAAWIDGTHPKRTTGGHPWEIKRGGNTTHIDMYVMRPPYQKEGFQIMLRAAALGRLAETLRMLLAIHGEGLPITLDDAEGVRKRLLGQDNIGILPEYETPHRAQQLFDKSKDVYDVLHLADLGRYKRRLTRFITWVPLPLFVPLDPGRNNF